MMKSLYSGVAGLKVHNQRMDVIGNNISNVNTTAYKASTVTFKDIFYQNKSEATTGTILKGGRNANQIGYGANLGAIEQVMTQSGFTYSDIATDCAIQGEGFFRVMDKAGNIYYTRNGSFHIDNYGNLCDPNGNVVLGVSGDPTNVDASSDRINLYVPPVDDKAASVTKTFKFDGDAYNYTLSNRLVGPEGNIALTILDLDDGETPFAVQNGSSLTVHMNLNGNYTNVNEFQAAFDAALEKGDINLGRGFGVDFDFETLPWEIEPLKTEYSVNLPSGALIFTAGKDGTAGDNFTINIVSSDTVDGVEAEWNDDELTITLPMEQAYEDDDNDPSTPDVAYMRTKSVTAGQIEAAILQAAGGDAVKRLTVTGNNVEPIRDGLAAAATSTIIQSGREGVLQLPIQAKNSIEIGNSAKLVFTAAQGGDKANGYEINVKMNDKLSEPVAKWNEGVLTITLPSNEPLSEEQLNALLSRAAGENASKMLTVNIQRKNADNEWEDSDDPLSSEDIKLIGDKIYRTALTGGVNGFFKDFADAMDTVRLTGGRYAANQTTKDLDQIYIDDDGVIYGVHGVHGTIAMGRIDLAIFENPMGLNQVGTSYWQPSLSSGDPEIKSPNDLGVGAIVSKALEMSNADLAQEISDMIITQRGYQANSRVITVTDTMLEELVNLKR